jgi:hypothetical protein
MNKIVSVVALPLILSFPGIAFSQTTQSSQSTSVNPNNECPSKIVTFVGDAGENVTIKCDSIQMSRSDYNNSPNNQIKACKVEMELIEGDDVVISCFGDKTTKYNMTKKFYETYFKNSLQQ